MRLYDQQVGSTNFIIIGTPTEFDHAKTLFDGDGKSCSGAVLVTVRIRERIDAGARQAR